ncbi:MAG: FAD-dependent oxidoreductase, partial [Nanoarchaeota archaeon]
RPNAGFMKKHLGDSLDKRGFIKVDDQFRVKGHQHIYAVGDVTNIKEEKLAQNAEAHASILCHNLLNKAKQHYVSRQRALLISLGKHDGIFAYKNSMFHGIIPVKLKGFVERKSMKKYMKKN